MASARDDLQQDHSAKMDSSVRFLATELIHSVSIAIKCKTFHFLFIINSNLT